MGKNNRLKFGREKTNFKLYKAKKHWVTACTTFFITLASVAIATNLNAHAASDNVAARVSLAPDQKVAATNQALGGSSAVLAKSSQQSTVTGAEQSAADKASSKTTAQIRLNQRSNASGKTDGGAVQTDSNRHQVPVVNSSVARQTDDSQTVDPISKSTSSAAKAAAGAANKLDSVANEPLLPVSSIDKSRPSTDSNTSESKSNDDNTIQVSSASQWPSTSKAADRVELTKSVTRTIHLTGIDTNPAPVKQVVTFTRTAIVNQDTGQVVGWVNPTDNAKMLAASDGDRAWQTPAGDSWAAYQPTFAHYIIEKITYNGHDYRTNTVSSSLAGDITSNEYGWLTGIGLKPGILPKDQDIDVTINFTKAYFFINIVDRQNAQMIGGGLVDVNYNNNEGYIDVKPAPGINRDDYYGCSISQLPEHYGIYSDWRTRDAHKVFSPENPGNPWNPQYYWDHNIPNNQKTQLSKEQLWGKTFVIGAYQYQQNTVQFKDSDDNDRVVGTFMMPRGTINQTVALNGLRVPNNYALAAGQTLPTTYKYAGAKSDGALLPNEPLAMQLVHQTITITDPSQAKIQATRQLKVHFLDSATGEKVHPDAVLNIFYKRSAAKDMVTQKISYGDWQRDPVRGKSNTPGFEVVSGDWTGLASSGHAAADLIQATLPKKDDYTAVNTAADGHNLTNEFSQSALDENPEAGDQNRTVYYVSNKVLNQTVTRKINIADPESGVVKPVLQTVNFARLARVKETTDGITFGALKNNDPHSFLTGNDLWNSAMSDDGEVSFNHDGTAATNPHGHWDAYDLAKPGFTALVTDNSRTVTAPEIVANPDVTATTNDHIINVTYVKNAATIKLEHDEMDQVFNNQLAVAPTDIKVRVTANDSHLTLPAGINKVVLSESDFSWYPVRADGSVSETPLEAAPKAAGTYHLALNDNGLQHFKKLSSNFSWDYDSATSYLLYKIIPTNVTAKLSGDSAKVFDGLAASTGDLNRLGSIKVTINGQRAGIDQSLNYRLQSGDYHWLTVDGSAPISVGTYQIALNKDTIVHHLREMVNKNPTWRGNVTINADDIEGGTAKLTIKPRPIKVKQRGEFNGTYDGSPVDKKLVSLTASTNWSVTGLVIGADLDTTNLKASDFSWYQLNDGEIDPVALSGAPSNAGRYLIKLNRNGIKSLQTTNPNYSFNTVSGGYAYQITPAPGSATLSGQLVKTYDGTGAIKLSAGNAPVKVSVDYPGSGENATYFLKSGDYEFVDSRGTVYLSGQAPIKPGTYTIRLTAQGRAAITRLGNDSHQNIDWSTANAISGTATYIIDRANANVSLNPATNSQTVIFNGQNRQLDLAKFAPAINTIPGVPAPIPSVKLKETDYTVKDASGQVVENPIKAGTYDVFLNSKGMAALQRLEGADNFSWAPATGHGILVIKPALAKVSFSGAGQKDYDDKAVDTTTINHGGKIIAKIQIADSDHLLSYALQNGDYDWFQGTKRLVRPPKEAGTYRIQLNNDAIRSLQAAVAADRDWKDNVVIDQKVAPSNLGTATYTIKPLPIQVKISPQVNFQTAVFNHQPVALNPDKFIPALKANAVELPTIPADVLTVDDFTIRDANGQVISHLKDLVNAGSYTVLLKQSGRDKLAALDSNFVWPASIDGGGQLIIKPAAAVAQLTGSVNTIYDGEVVSTSDLNQGITVKVAYQPSSTKGSSDLLLNYHLTDGDYKWMTPDGKVPINAGSYRITLTQSAYQKLQQLLNQQFGTGNIIFEQPAGGSDEVNVMPCKVKAAVIGSFTVDAGTTEIPADKYYLRYVSEVSGQSLPSSLVQPTNSLSAKQLRFVGPQPTPETASQDFVVGYAGSVDDLQKTLGANYLVTYVDPPMPNYHVTGQSFQTVQYVDDHGKVIQALAPIHGKKGTDIHIDSAAFLPPNWVPVDGESLPTAVTISGGITQIKIKHGTKVIGRDSPTDWPAGLSKDDFDKIVTRTIKITDNHGHDKSVIQTAVLTRIGIKDLITNAVVWQAWTTGIWPELIIPAIAGYTPSHAQVPAEFVNTETENQTISVTYTANDQQMNIIYQDAGGAVIKSDSLSGKTDQTVTADSKLPNGWELAPGQSAAPATITFSGDQTPNLIILISHRHRKVSHLAPLTTSARTSTGRLIKGAKESDLNKTFTRTIKVTGPDGKVTVTSQKARIDRDASYDDVTGEVTYTGWTTDSKGWAEFNVPNVPGYTPSRFKVPATRVGEGQGDVTVSITYNPNQQRGQIQYLDGDQVVVSSPLTGLTGQVVAIRPQLPDHYLLLADQQLPTDVVATAAGIPTVKIFLVHEQKDIRQSRKATRTVKVQNPSGRNNVVSQIAELTRSGSHDLVTGTDHWGEWTTGRWDEYRLPVIAGYRPSLEVVAQQTVTDKTQDVEVDVSYTADPQTGKIIYVDGDDANRTVGSTTLSGPTDSEVSVNPQVPTNFTLVAGQNIPTKVRATATGIPTVIIKVQHQLSPLKASKTVTRTILITDPDGRTSSITQQVTIKHDGEHDEVTKLDRWQAWSTALWPAYHIKAVAGFQPSPSIVPSKLVNEETTDERIEVVYHPDEQRSAYQFVDDETAGQVVKSGQLTGHTRQTVKLDLVIPENYQLAKGQALPDQYRFSLVNQPLVIHVVHQRQTLPDDTKMVFRTITLRLPDETSQELSQKVILHRNAVKDLVTGQTEYGQWSTEKFAKVVTPFVPGYLPSQLVVGEQEASSDYTDPQIIVTYSALAPTKPNGASQLPQPNESPNTHQDNNDVNSSHQQEQQPGDFDHHLPPETPQGSVSQIHPVKPTNSDTTDQLAKPNSGKGPISEPLSDNSTSAAKRSTLSSLPQQEVRPIRRSVSIEISAESMGQLSNISNLYHHRLPQTGQQPEKLSLLGLCGLGLAGLLGLRRKRSE